MIFGNNGQHIYPLRVVDLFACFCEELNKTGLEKKREAGTEFVQRYAAVLLVSSQCCNSLHAWLHDRKP